MFVVVEFEKDGGLAVVRNKWLTPRKKEVFWPPVKEQRLYNKIVKDDDVQVDSAEWKLYKITRHFYETDNFDKAEAKLKVAEFTSDLASDEENGNEKRRVSKKPRRFSSSDDEEDNLPLKRPPAIFKEGTQVGTQNCLPISFNVLNSTSKCPRFPLENTASSSSRSTIQEDSFSASPKTSTPKIFAPSSNESTPTAASADISASTGFQRKLLTKLIVIEEQNKEILEILKGQSVTTNTAAGINLPVNLPIKENDDLVRFDDYLQEHQNHYTQFVRKLASFGGKDLTNSTYRILKHILTDDLASSYSFYGKRSGKKHFCSLRLKTGIIEAVQTSVPRATEKDIEGAIKAWLKHAPERLRRVSK